MALSGSKLSYFKPSNEFKEFSVAITVPYLKEDIKEFNSDNVQLVITPSENKYSIKITVTIKADSEKKNFICPKIDEAFRNAIGILSKQPGITSKETDKIFSDYERSAQSISLKSPGAVKNSSNSTFKIGGNIAF